MLWPWLVAGLVAVLVGWLGLVLLPRAYWMIRRPGLGPAPPGLQRQFGVSRVKTVAPEGPAS